jgi:membrane dipeptidase
VVGAGGFLGDASASTETIFRCVDYLVELVGPEHVGIGMDYVHYADAAFEKRKKSPKAWPNPVRYEYASPEQIVPLTCMMLQHGYPVEAVRGILGENWARVCSKVWH